MPIPNVKGNEDESTYIGRCMEAIGGEYDDQAQPLAICYGTYRKATMQSLQRPEDRVAQRLKFNSDFRGINLQEDDMENPCWSGWEMIGTKILDGREVPNCVPIKED
jgi:hypothetical protein